MLLMGYCYAHAQTVPIPNPNWPLDSVINQSVHLFTVPGDRNFAEPSTFTWNVDGGRLFYDEALTRMAGNGTTATVDGDANNITRLWVVWDSFDQPLDTGYVYVYEISADGCVRPDSDPGKYQGLRIKVSAPPKVRFLAYETITCSNENGVTVDIVIDGMPPFDLKYSINGVRYDWHILPSDLIDSDMDGQTDNVTLLIDDYPGTTSDLIYQIELLEASSGGVLGEILQYRAHTVYAFVQPMPPVISPDWPEVTVGESHLYLLSDQGENPAIKYWELRDELGTIVNEYSSTVQSDVTINFNFEPGIYTLVAYYMSQNGCMSHEATHTIELFDQPTIAFAETSLNALGCSEVSLFPNEFFDFFIDYQGARSFNFTFAVYDYNGVLVGEYDVENQVERDLTITISNTFVNSELPEINRAWKVKIIEARNEEMINITILDSGIDGGRDERLIYIHPKPIITEDIDFAN